ncbi:MAG TPA: hypothetical protein PLZ57_07835 [Pseudobdellovibrionaceae bacterium]|nr:hypothetical protein [Pseudobdellovibrionaceae bacterium]
MKKVTALVAAMVATTAMNAHAHSLQAASEVSADSVQGLVKAAEQLGKNSVQFSKDGVRLSGKGLSALFDMTVDSAKSTSGAISQAGNYTVEKVESAASASIRLVQVTFKHVRSGTLFVVNFSFDASTAVGSASLDAAKTLLLIGRNLVIATSASGVVIVTDSLTGSKMMASGEITEGSKMMIGSLGRAAKTFGSHAVRDLDVRASDWPQESGY